MNLSSIASKLSHVMTELRRPNLTTEDKGRLVLVKDKLTKAMTVEETAAKKALETLYKDEMADAQYKYDEAKKAAGQFSEAIQKELLNVQKGFEATERLAQLIDENARAMAAIKSNETNNVHPRTSQATILLQSKFITTAVVCDFFKALNVNFNNINSYKGYFLSHGVKKDNINDLISDLSKMKFTNVDIEQWYSDHHTVKSQISQDVQALIKEDK